MGHGRPARRHEQAQEPVLPRTRAGAFAGGASQSQSLAPGFCPSWDRNYVQHQGSVRQGFLFVIGGADCPSLSTAGPAVVSQVFHSHPGSFMASGVRLICGLHPAPGRRRPQTYTKSHGLKATRGWNRKIQQHACRRPGDSIFDAFTPTLNATSFDGLHYWTEANLVLAQLLLNHLAGLLQGPPPPRSDTNTSQPSSTRRGREG